MSVCDPLVARELVSLGPWVPEPFVWGRKCRFLCNTTTGGLPSDFFLVNFLFLFSLIRKLSAELTKGLLGAR